MDSPQQPPRERSTAPRLASGALARLAARAASQPWLVLALVGVAIISSVGWGVTALQLHSALGDATSQGSSNATAATASGHLTGGQVLPPGSKLPSDAACAAAVPSSTWEPRPANATANAKMPTADQLANVGPWDTSRGMDAKSDALRQRVTGHYTGTTDQILQWAACKWGVDPDIVRAQAVVESYWRMSAAGDMTSDSATCPPQALYKGSQCYQTYGILQIKYPYYTSAFPMAREDTAFNADYVYGWMRNCYEGWADYLYDRTPATGFAKYHAGDIWGCIGFWYSGSWYDSSALPYIAHVKAVYANKIWLTASFAGAR